MRQTLAILLSILWGVGSGLIIATGILAFITAIGIIPRLSQKTNTKSYYLFYETCTVVGATLGNVLMLFDCTIPLPHLVIGALGLCAGIFTGCLAVAITEVLNVIPIMKARLKLQYDIRWALFLFAMGKMIGSLYYWFYPGFRN